MDRYIVREPRGEGYAQGNQIIAFSPGTRGSTMVPETMYFGGYGAEIPNMQQRPGIVGVTHHLNFPYASTNAGQQHPQAQMISGIDPRYLAAYNDRRVYNEPKPYNATQKDDGNTTFIAGQMNQMERERPHPTITSQPPNQHYMNDYYRNNNFGAANPYAGNTFTPQPQHVTPSASAASTVNPSPGGSMIPMKRKIDTNENDSQHNVPKDVNNNILRTRPNSGGNVALPTKQAAPNTDVLQKELPNQPQLLTRVDKLKALQRSGPRAFSGPVEKVVKWHKALHDIGVLVLYEIVAKCVNVRAGEGCAKNLVIRDDNGPALQVVYYEIDFRLPELKVPCTIRVIGRMQPGTCRLQAFSVRMATSDDVATISRRAAVAAHHVAKLCKEYGPNTA